MTQDPTTDKATLSRRTKRSRKRRRYVETSEMVAALCRLVRSVGRRLAEEDATDLVLLVRLSHELDEAWSTAITGLRASDYSDAQIGQVLGVSKQAVAQRWPRSTS